MALFLSGSLFFNCVWKSTPSLPRHRLVWANFKLYSEFLPNSSYSTIPYKSTSKAEQKSCQPRRTNTPCRKNISIICLETPLKLDIHITKISNNQTDIKLRQFTQEEINEVLTKIKDRKAAGLHQIPREVRKKMKFNELLL